MNNKLLKNTLKKVFPRMYRQTLQYRLKRNRLTSYFIEDIAKLNSSNVVIDLGANVGHISEILAKTGARVISFEPSSNAFLQLSQVSRDYENLEVLNVAAGVKNDKVLLYLNENTEELPNEDLTQSSSLLEDKPNVSKLLYEEIEEIDFAEFLKKIDVYVDILKIDIEGYEINLLNHLIDEDMFKRIGNVYVETHEHKFPGLLEPTKALIERVNALGLSEKIRFDWH